MAVRDHAAHGLPCWIDLTTSDAEASHAFYAGLFGWTTEPAMPESGGHARYLRDGVPVAGVMAGGAGTGPSDAWSVYLGTQDAQQTADSAQARGGQVLVPPMAVGDLGTSAVLADPGGASVGAWQAGALAGFGAVGEHGAPGWFELHTRDYSSVLDFYRDVFGWDVESVSDTEEFRYTVVKNGEEQHAGVMDASGFLVEGAAASWSVYFGVDDVDAALARAVELGGEVVLPAEDTPYGRLAAALDSNGAVFKLVGRAAGTPAAQE